MLQPLVTPPKGVTQPGSLGKDASPGTDNRSKDARKGPSLGDMYSMEDGKHIENFAKSGSEPKAPNSSKSSNFVTDSGNELIKNYGK